MQKKVIGTLAVCGCLLPTALGWAQAVTGTALITNNNIMKAREEARRDAMRTYVEEKVGVHINSTTETVNFVLTRDRILAEAEGYVLVKKILQETRQNGILRLTLDLETGTKPLELGLEDSKNYLRNLSSNSSRYGLDIALSDRSGTVYWSNYLAGRLAQAGYRAYANEAINQYLALHPYENDLTLNAEARRLGRYDQQGNALIRGRINMARRAELTAPGVYRAVAELTANVVAYDSNAMDAVAEYAEGLGPTPEAAEHRAAEQAVDVAVEKLVRQSVITTQLETKGGVQNITTQLRFDGIADRTADYEAVKNAVMNANCNIRLCAYQGNYLIVALRTGGYSNLNEAVDGILEQLHYVYPGAYPEYLNTVGSTQYLVHLRG